MFPRQQITTPSLPKLSIITASVGEEEELAPVQGIMPDSLPEYWISRALDRYRHTYIFQFQILDIRGVKGSYKIDWLITSTVPLSTPMEYFGDFWHKGQMGSEDQFRLVQIEDHFRGQANEMVIIWSSEAMTKEDCESVVLRKIGRA